MVGEAFGALAAFKAILDGLNALKSVDDRVMRGQAISTMLDAVLAAQTAQLALVQRVGALEAEKASFERWQEEKDRYELKELGRPGIFAHVLKPSMQGEQPPHSICPDCYEQRVKSVLQHVNRDPGRCELLICPRCGWEVYLTGGWEPEHGATKSASRRR